MPSADLHEFISRVQMIERIADLWKITLDFLHACGIARVSYHHFEANEALNVSITADGFPEDWVCHYIEDELYKVDPIPAFTRRVSRPFLWTDTPQLAELTEQQQDYLKELDNWGIGNGLALRVYGPGMRDGYVGLGFDSDAPVPGAEKVVELQMACQLAHQRFCEITEQRRLAPFDLSPREREVLTWVARGKSNSVISQILDISRHTVDTHLRSVFSKLDVTDRTSAAIIGVGSSLIQRDARLIT